MKEYDDGSGGIGIMWIMMLQPISRWHTEYTKKKKKSDVKPPFGRHIPLWFHISDTQEQQLRENYLE